MSQSEGGSGGSDGTGYGWFLGVIALCAMLGALCISGGVAVGEVTGGSIGLSAESHDLAGLLLVVGFVALGMATRHKND